LQPTDLPAVPGQPIRLPPGFGLLKPIFYSLKN
jgi:hypothetical protein